MLLTVWSGNCIEDQEPYPRGPAVAPTMCVGDRCSEDQEPTEK